MADRIAPLFLALEVPDFPAQAMAAWDPSLRDRAFVVVDQDPENHKTRVIACSPPARDLGIQAGLPYAQVRRRWRGVPALFRKPAWEAALREELEACCRGHTPAYEVREDGGALLDLAGTPSLREAVLRGAPSVDAPGGAPWVDAPGGAPEAGSAEAAGKVLAFPGLAIPPGCRPALLLARRLQHEIRARTGLAEAAYGIAATRLMARVMARQARHDRQDSQARSMGIRICPPGREAELLAPLEPSVLPGLSPQCRERIRRYALASIRQIQALGRSALSARFGAEGDKLHTLASGLDLAPAAAPPPGIRVETVLEEDLNDDDALFRKVRLTADKLAFRLRQEGATAARIVVSIRYSDHKSARKTLKVVPATDVYKEIADLALAGFRALHVRRVALKAIALTVSQPGVDKGQVDLFEESRDKKARALGDALTRIRGRSGFAVIGAAGS